MFNSVDILLYSVYCKKRIHHNRFKVYNNKYLRYELSKQQTFFYPLHWVLKGYILLIIFFAIEPK